MTESFGKYEQMHSFADKTTDRDTLKSDLENWLSDVTVETTKFWKRLAREYIDGLPETQKSSQSSIKSALRDKSASQTSKTSTHLISRTSS